MVSTPADLVQVLIGDGGLLADPDRVPGAVVDCSTVDDETSLAMRTACAERGVDFLAAPVSGNGKVVAAGRLTLVVSGPRGDLGRGRAPARPSRPRARRTSARATWPGSVKICHNVMLGVVTQCLAEITVLAEKGGVPRAAFLEFLNKSVMGSTFTRYKSPAFVHLDYTPTFTPVLLRKDFDLGFAAAHDLDVPMPVAAAAAAAVQAAVSHRPRRRGLRDPARAAGPQLRDSSWSPRTSRWTTGSPERPRREPTAARRPGHMGVDYEQRVDFARLRDYRLGSGHRPRSRPASAAPSCSSTSTTSATPRTPGSAARSATR